MADEIFEHHHDPLDGHVISEVHGEAEAETAAVELETHAAVEIAQIEADKEIQLTKLAVKAEESHDETEVESLRAEIRGMRETLDRLIPPVPAEAESAPEPIVVNDAPVEAEPTDLPEAEHHREPPKPRKTSLGMW
jgi:hypothetical protein